MKSESKGTDPLPSWLIAPGPLLSPGQEVPTGGGTLLS